MAVPQREQWPASQRMQKQRYFEGAAISTRHIFVLSSVSDYKILRHITEGILFLSTRVISKPNVTGLRYILGVVGKEKKTKKNGLIWHCVRDCRHLRLQNQLARVWVSGSSDGQNSSRRILSEMNGFRETCSPLSTHLIRTTLVHKSSVSTPSGCFSHFLTPGQKGE